MTKSVVFKNAYTDLSWSNPYRFLNRLSPNDLFRHGYSGISNQQHTIPIDDNSESSKVFWRWPSIDETDEEDPMLEYVDDNRDLSLDSGLNELKKLLIQPRQRSFFLQAHFKFMHYPYLKNGYLSDPHFRANFNSQELTLLSEYEKNFSKYSEKIAFFEVMFQNKEFLEWKEKKFGKKNILSISKIYLMKWKLSKNFSTDLKLLNKVYSYRLQLLNNYLSTFLEFYYEKLDANTILVLTGDHGEAFFQHDNLIHAEKPYDEIINFFLAFHFPNQKNLIVENRQLSQVAFAKTIIKLISEPMAKENELIGKIDFNKSEEIYSFNCNGTVASLRFKNKWKAILDQETNKIELFDLQSDSHELRDVSQLHPDLSQEFAIKIQLELGKGKLFSETCLMNLNYDLFK